MKQHKKKARPVKDLEKYPIYHGKNRHNGVARTVGAIEDPVWREQVLISLTSERDTDVRILGEGVMAKSHSLNNDHDLIVGATSAGKTRGYVVPNLFYENASKIVSDTKGILYDRYGKALRKMGYRVENINLIDPARSTVGYNPFDFITKDGTGNYCSTDIKKIAEALIPTKICDEPFWAQQGAMYLEFAISFVCEMFSEKYHSFASVEEIVNLIGSDRLKEDVFELSAKKPGCLAARTYPKILSQIGADRMHGSIMGFVNNALNQVVDNDLETLYGMKNVISFADLGRRKTIVFITVSDTDSTKDTLVSLFYTQAFQELVRTADKSSFSRLSVPVRMILDDYAASVHINELERLISVVRTRNIAVSVILQSIAQLKAKHGEENATVILDNFDTQVFLGGLNVETSKYFSVMMDKLPISLLTLPTDKECVFIRGQKPQVADKYDLCRHEDSLFNMFEEELEDIENLYAEV